MKPDNHDGLRTTMGDRSQTPYCSSQSPMPRQGLGSRLKGYVCKLLVFSTLSAGLFGTLGAGVGGVSGCAENRHAYRTADIAPAVDIVERDFSEEEYSKLEDALLDKLSMMYFDAEYVPGTVDDFKARAKSLLFEGDDLSLFRENIEKVLIELGWKGYDLPENFLPTSEYDADELGSIDYLIDEKCPVISFHKRANNTVYVNDFSKFTYHNGGHETSHGAVDNESWANYLSLRGAIVADNEDWLFTELFYLYWTLTVSRFSDPPRACTKKIKSRWNQYFQDTVDLFMSDTFLRKYFGLDDKDSETVGPNVQLVELPDSPYEEGLSAEE